MKKRLPSTAVFALGLLFAVAVRGADTPGQGITFFRADVTVRPDATLEVREEIVVKDATAYYKRGFARAMPIDSDDRWDRRFVGQYQRDNGIRVEILEVSKNGVAVTYKHGEGYGYPLLEIGEENVPLPGGEHRYVIRYTVSGTVRSGRGRDALYWNANGHGHVAPIAESILSIHLPAGVEDSDVLEARVAGRGVSSPRQADTELERVDGEANTVTYRATNVRPRQSLSLAVSWPAGYIHAPKYPWLTRGRWLLGVPATLFLFYLVAWLKIGPEPEPGAVVTRYEPPEGLSAAAVRYIVTTGSDGRSFAAVIAALAESGCLRVERRDGNYKLSRMMSDRATEAKLAPEEQCVLKMLFEDGPEIELTPAMDQRNSAQNSRYVAAIQRELNQRLEGLYLTKHAGVVAFGVLGTIVSALALAATAQGRDTSGVMFLTMWALFVGMLIGMIFVMAFLPACKAALVAHGGWLKLLPGLGALGAFGAVIVYALRQLAEGVSPTFSFTIAALILINVVWGPQLKRRTEKGREVLDQIAGFRLFLEKVEQDRLEKLNPADEQLQLTDAHLPYAIALEVREAWGDHLAQTFFATTVMR
jgi:predicted membrane protein DUF2207